jgi:hypothetical protein
MGRTRRSRARPVLLLISMRVRRSMTRSWRSSTSEVGQELDLTATAQSGRARFEAPASGITDEGPTEQAEVDLVGGLEEVRIERGDAGLEGAGSAGARQIVGGSYGGHGGGALVPSSLWSRRLADILRSRIICRSGGGDDRPNAAATPSPSSPLAERPGGVVSLRASRVPRPPRVSCAPPPRNQAQRGWRVSRRQGPLRPSPPRPRPRHRRHLRRRHPRPRPPRPHRPRRALLPALAARGASYSDHPGTKHGNRRRTYTGKSGRL